MWWEESQRWAWRCSPVNPAVRMWRQGGCEFQDSLDYIEIKTARNMQGTETGIIENLAGVLFFKVRSFL